MNEQDKPRKVRIGWFSFACCEDNTIVMTELLNDRWQEWRELFDFRHARVLQTNNVLDQMDIAFIEGAVAGEPQAQEIREIRKLATLVVAIGSCAVTGMPSAQRNLFSDEQKQDVGFLVERFGHLDQVLKLSDVIKVDAEVPGCSMDPQRFLDTVDSAVAQVRAGWASEK
ncbi:hypothetical protein COY93_01625 [Candidatus Uhrbacteria bacterium CG_4_10_14_0_8_um_filter_58_22]|uniref:NADH:ubiquinone oxidoreductase-like 20kDa subunit domain-containing protein n=1 Tax=Candidatus Uhrbacteria bacterium CG_4_10_14_0_8_um_filter_58_22 TaxID=1975029 RepID=A0A2M7QAD3_9BACT|nr:MAG: hypothetical protein AUJ19_03345 [Parcubacteria group bacterium CG1_02_58_44]PIY62984.1 MAG: hypothetical protein COY93_01625 [Candidatus Uhrbacteria bacterium CG_4_10_14_0_8_um_filter_58_22]